MFVRSLFVRNFNGLPWESGLSRGVAKGQVIIQSDPVSLKINKDDHTVLQLKWNMLQTNETS